VLNTNSAPANWARPFFTIWIGQAFSLLGSSLAGFALVWWLTSTTGSATILAIGTLMQVLPQIVLGPLLGALVDRWNRRLVLLVSDSVIAAFSFGLVLLFWLGKTAFWHVYIVLFVRAVGGVFHLLAMQASTPLMVPGKHLGRVAGANQTLQGVTNIVAPALSAVLLGILPIQGVLIIDVGTALLAVLPLFFIAIPQPVFTIAAGPEHSVTIPEQASLGQELREGLRFVWGWAGLRTIILLAMISNLMTIPAMSFLPLMVTKYFGGGVLEVGWMSTVQGAGLLCGGLLLTIWGGFKERILTILPAVIVMGLGLGGIGLAPSNLFMLGLVGNFIFCLMRPVIDGSMFAFLQSIIPPEKQGRVLSIVLSGSAASALLGLLVAGPVVDATSLPLWFILSGMISVAVGISGFLLPSVIGIEQGRLSDQNTRSNLI
jgi:DHA3 family macrolide efflux protein-like MFS transporter